MQIKIYKYHPPANEQEWLAMYKDAEDRFRREYGVSDDVTFETHVQGQDLYVGILTTDLDKDIQNSEDVSGPLRAMLRKRRDAEDLPPMR